MIRLTVERQGVARLPPTRGGLRIGGFCRHDSAVRHCQQGKGPIRANGKGLVFSRRVGDALSKNFANLRRDSSTLGEEIHPRACVTRTISGRECPCGHSLPHRSAQSVLSVRTCLRHPAVSELVVEGDSAHREKAVESMSFEERQRERVTHVARIGVPPGPTTVVGGLPCAKVIQAATSKFAFTCSRSFPCNPNQLTFPDLPSC